MKNLNKFSKTIGQLLLVILISFFQWSIRKFGCSSVQPKSREVENKIVQAVTQTASKNENSTTQAVDKVKDAVVSIITYSETLKVVCWNR